MGAGHEWGDEDCPPRPGTFSQSDGTCWEIGSHLERELSRAYLECTEAVEILSPSAGTAPFPLSCTGVIREAPPALPSLGAQPVPVFLLLMKDLFRSPLPPVHSTAD